MRWFHILWTITLFALFIGVILWAWSSRRKQSFEDAAQIPLDDDMSRNHPKAKTEDGDV
ncbi:MAG: cbb3-type cytochrome c oxidase subunit 3 [Gammaproteobacteria bacterium]|nr:cbb3-type cytochrome c oxidase subunit 3 [Gammaproteobacteria bacterium]